MKTENTATLKSIVTNILTKYPATRDNDIKLIVKYCKKTGKSTDLKDWVGDQHNGLESIRRVRQLIQQNNPELRGSKYVQRARKATQTYVRQAVHE